MTVPKNLGKPNVLGHSLLVDSQQAATQVQEGQSPPVDHIQDVIKPQRFEKTPLLQGKTQDEFHVCESSKTTVAALGTQYPEHTVFERHYTSDMVEKSTHKNITYLPNNDHEYTGIREQLNAPTMEAGYHSHPAFQ